MKNLVSNLNGRSWIILFGALICCGTLYVIFAPVYLGGVVFLSEYLLQLIFNNLQLSLSPQRTLLLVPAPFVEVNIADDLFSVALNVVFPPAIVIAILGLTRLGLLQALTSVVLMALGHTVLILCITLHFLKTKGHIFIPTHTLAPFSGLIDTVYLFYQAGMSDVFLPLLVLFIVCFRYISRFSYQPTPSAAVELLKRAESTKKKRKSRQHKRAQRR